MLAFGLRVLYAGEVLDGGLLQILPGGRPAAEPGAGGRAEYRGARPGNAALSCLRAALSPGREAALLLRGLLQGRKAEETAGIYAEIPGVRREHLGV